MKNGNYVLKNIIITKSLVIEEEMTTI